MTVSHVINDHPHVRPETREKVLEAIARLDYRVNVAARNLRSGRTGMIGLAVPEVDRPYYGQLAARILAEAARHGLRVAIEQTGRSRRHELDALTMSRNRLYDGLILPVVGLDPSDADLLKVDYPVVILGERIFHGPVDHVAMPNVEGAQAATAHLVSRGCGRVVMLGGEPARDVGMSWLRFTGYQQALAAAGLPYDSSLVVPLEQVTMSQGRDGIRRLIRSGVSFDGVFCVTDTVAIGALRGLADEGIDVPGQVKVIGFDDIDESKYLVPSLSSVDPDHPAMARTAVDLLVRRIQGKDRDYHATEIVSKYAIVARESTSVR